MEADEQLLHEIRQYCLMNVPIRSLWLSRIRKINPDFKVDVHQIQIFAVTPELLWDAYEEKMALNRLYISKSETADELATAMTSGIAIQEWYEIEMLRLFIEWPDTAKAVKASEWISTGAIRFEYRNWLNAGGELQKASTYTPNLLLELKRVRKLRSLKQSI